MLDLRRPILPRLKFVDDADDLYMLDWSKKQMTDLNDDADRYKAYHGENWDDYFYLIRRDHLKILYDFRFKIDRQMLKAIEYQSMQGVFERNIPYDGDTMIREMCMESANQHFYNAFRILVDRVEKPSYELLPTTFIHKMCLVHFWDHQTGAGLVLSHSFLDDGNIQFFREQWSNHKLLNEILDHILYVEDVRRKTPNPMAKFKNPKLG